QIDRISDVRMRHVRVQQHTAVPLTEDVGWKNVRKFPSQAPPARIIALDERLENFSDGQMESRENGDRRRRVRSAVCHQRYVSPTRGRTMLRVVASVAHRVTAVRPLQSCVKALVEVRTRLRKENDLTLIDLIDLARGLRDRSRSCHDPRRPRLTALPDD